MVSLVPHGRAGTQRAGGLTEAQINELSEEMGIVPEAIKNASSTVSWWQGRQARFNAQLQQRQKKLASGVSKALNGGSETPQKVRR